MKKLLLMSLLSLNVFAIEGDLTINEPRWEGKFSGVICQAFGRPVKAPSSLQQLEVNFEKMVTDYTLDNGLITASFKVKGQLCHYSAIMLADNDKATIKMLDSKAFSTTAGVDCTLGKNILDELLIPVNNYLYYGHPHNIAIMVNTSEATEVCGADASQVGINFTVSGRVQN